MTPPRGCTSRELFNTFPTVLLRRYMPDAETKNARLREIVLDRERRDAGVRHSNIGGWHSSPDLWEWPEPEVRELCTWVIRAGEDLTASVARLQPGDQIRARPFGGAWANLLREGSYNKVHNHPGAVWSAVYYVATGKADPQRPGNGCLEFMDPRPANIHGGKEVIEPEAGLLIMFPAWIFHYVNPFHGTGERISIAFNLDVEILRNAPAPS